jgi:hypothetical protein
MRPAPATTTLPESARSPGALRIGQQGLVDLERVGDERFAVYRRLVSGHKLDHVAEHNLGNRHLHH